MQKEKSRHRSEDTKNNNQEADNVLEGKKEGRGGMMGQQRLIICVGSLVYADQHFLQLHRENPWLLFGVF